MLDELFYDYLSKPSKSWQGSKQLLSQDLRKFWDPRSEGVLELFLPQRQLLIKANLHFSFDGLNMKGLEIKTQGMSTT